MNRARPFETTDREIRDYLRGLESGPEIDRAAPPGVMAGSLGFGSGGPAYLDAYHSKRPPNLYELVNAVKAVAYACMQINAKAMPKVPLRLYATTNKRKGQRKPRRSYRAVSDDRQRFLRGLIPRNPGSYSWSRTDLARSLSEDDDIDEVTESPILEALKNPNPHFDWPTLIQHATLSLDAIGSAYIAPTRVIDPKTGVGDPTWAPSELWPLQAQYVYPVKGTEGEVLREWRYFTDTFAPQELVWIRHVSLRDPYLSGYSPLHACYEQIGLVDYYTASVEGILKGGAMPLGIVGPKDPFQRWGPAERKRLEADIHNSQTGARKGRWWITEGSFDAQTLSYSPLDLGGLELTKEQRLLAANCFDVPISLLQTENSNRATAQESTHQHQYYAVAPRCCMIDAALTKQLVHPVDERQFLAFDNPVARQVEVESKVFDMAIRNNSRTINDVREELKLEPLPWGDEAFAPMAGPMPSEEKSKEGEAEAVVVPPEDQIVQDQALNGAQIASFVQIIQAVRDGVIPPESAKALLAASFPTLDDTEVGKIIDPIEVKPLPEPADPVELATAVAKAKNSGKPAGPPPDAQRSALYDKMNGLMDTLAQRLER